MTSAIEKSLAAMEALLKRQSAPWTATDLDLLEAACTQARHVVSGARRRATGFRPLLVPPLALETRTGRDLCSASQWFAHAARLHKPLFLPAAEALASHGRKAPALEMYTFLLADLPGDPDVLESLERAGRHSGIPVEDLAGEYRFRFAGRVRLEQAEWIRGLDAPPGLGHVLAADMAGNGFHILDFDGTWRRKVSLDVDGVSAVTFAQNLYWACDWGGSRILSLGERGELVREFRCDTLLPEGFPRHPERIRIMGRDMFVQFVRREGDSVKGNELASGLACFSLDDSGVRRVQAREFGPYFQGGMAVAGSKLLALNILSPSCLFAVSPENIEAATTLHADPYGYITGIGVSGNDFFLMRGDHLQKWSLDGRHVFSANTEYLGANMAAFAVGEYSGRTRAFAYQYTTKNILLFDL